MRSGTANFLRPAEAHVKSPTRATARTPTRRSSRGSDDRLQFLSEADMRACNSVQRAQFGERHFDLVVIGGGFAGLACASAALVAKEDISVLLVSRGPIGGTSIAWRRDTPKNIRSRGDLEKAVEKWETWRRSEVIRLLESAPKLNLVEGVASVTSIDEVDVECANGEFLITKPDRIVLASGASEEFTDPPVVPASQLLRLLPQVRDGKICVIGDDTQAVDCVGLCIRAGFAEQTVWILPGSCILADWEAEIGHEILSWHAEAGVTIMPDFGEASVRESEEADERGSIVVEGIETRFELVVRSCRTRCILPQGAASLVRTDQAGYALVDEKFHTSCKGRIYAIGACSTTITKRRLRSNLWGANPTQQGTRLGNSLFDTEKSSPATALFSIVWSCPPAGAAGLSEDEAAPLAEFGKVRVDLRRHGDTLVKLISVFNKEWAEWRVLGVGLVGNVDWLPGMVIALLSEANLDAFDKVLSLYPET